jgi:hypothetical protein
MPALHASHICAHRARLSFASPQVVVIRNDELRPIKQELSQLPHTLNAFENEQRRLELELREQKREVEPLRQSCNALHGELLELRTAGMRADEYNYARIQQLSKEFEAFVACAGASYMHRNRIIASRCAARLARLPLGSAQTHAMRTQHTLGARRSITRVRATPPQSAAASCCGADDKGLSLEQLARELLSVREQSTENRRVADAHQRQLEAYISEVEGRGAIWASTTEMDSLKLAFHDLTGKLRDSEALGRQHTSRLDRVEGLPDRVAAELEAAKDAAQRGDAVVLQRLEQRLDLSDKLSEKDRKELARLQLELAQVGARALNVCGQHARTQPRSTIVHG